MASDDLMSVDSFNSSTINLEFNLDDIGSLEDETHSSHFYHCNTLWYLSIVKHYKSNTPYLGIYVNKVDDTDKHPYSYDVQSTVTLKSYNTNGNHTRSDTETPTSRYVFGKRSGESMEWGWSDFVRWNDLLNPNLGYLGDYDDIDLTLEMNIRRVLPHNKYCQCEEC